MRYSFFFPFFFLFILSIHGQHYIQFSPGLSYYNLTGWETEQAIEGQLTHNNLKWRSGLKVVESNSKTSLWDSYFFSVEKKFRLHKFEFSGVILFNHRRIDNSIKKHNLSLVLDKQFVHWKIQIGNNSGIFYQSRKSLNNFAQKTTDPTQIKKWRNLLYRFEYSVNEQDALWNFSFALTNIDSFSPSQENNPFFETNFKKIWNKDWATVSTFRLYNAGMANLAANPFACFFQQSLRWKF